MNRDTDRLDWLREIRQEIVRRCGSDPKVMGDYFRNCQRQYQNRIITHTDIINPPDRLIQRPTTPLCKYVTPHERT